MSQLERAFKSRFAIHDLTDEKLKKIKDLQRGYKLVAAAIADTTPVGREQSLAMTALEESEMWAVKSVSAAPERIIG